MNMTTFNSVLNSSFKQFQLLPALSTGAGSVPAATAHLQVSWRTREAAVTRPHRTAPSTSTRLPMPSARITHAERWLMVLLALNAVVCVAQAFSGVAEWSRQWAGFEQWVARLLS